MARGKTLFLGPTGRGQIHDDTVERPGFKKLLDAGDVEVLDAGDQLAAADKTSAQIQGSSQGHPANKSSARKGDR